MDDSSFAETHLFPNQKPPKINSGYQQYAFFDALMKENAVHC